MNYTLRQLLDHDDTMRAVMDLHREYYEEWRRETDPALRALIAAKADCLDDVIGQLAVYAGDSDE